jgi:ferredoxin
LGEKEPLDDDMVSHGMCAECDHHFSRQWSGLRLGEYLDDIDLPAMAVDPDGRVIAANQRMAETLGKNDREYFGLLGGEVMECQYARLPEGCGKTVHCQTCAIRLTVTKVIDTGQPQLRVPAYLNQVESRVNMLISAYKHDEFVRIVIEEMGDGS